MKPGYKTTEWWISVVVTLASLLLASGALGPEDTATKIAALVVALGAQLGYSAGRSSVKAGAVATPPKMIDLHPVDRLR